MNLEIIPLLTAYRQGLAKPSEVISFVYEQIARAGERPVWISLVPRETALAQAQELDQRPPAALPLYGIPFAIKDNIDLAGLPTTAGCPAFSYRPAASASVVEKLVAAGAICVGKTNLDQFATGLVGTRSPYGACSSVFDPRSISGGSSSGSAVAVAKKLVSFSLGTDTAGSGRVPAAFNNLIGMKPTRGLLSTSGVVPACRSLDCVSIFAQTEADACAVFEVAKGFDSIDPYSRVPMPGEGAAPWQTHSGPFRFGVPAPGKLEFFGDTEAAALFSAAVKQMESIGGVQIEIDFSVFRATAELLYAGPWVAERLAAIETFARDHASEMDPVVASIITGAAKYSAIETFRAQYRLRELRRLTEQQWEGMDVILLPTAPTTYTHAQVKADPVGLNSRLGYYTNFVNLLDLAAIAVPAGFRRNNGLPFGVSLIGPAFSDEALLALAERFRSLPASAMGTPGCIAVAVVGAHLSGQPLNHQLTVRRARLMKTTRTSANYRFYALAGTKPLKPGLFRDLQFEGPGMEVEVWAVPENQFGSFVAAIPPPLGIGSVELADGSWVKGFICEPCALETATEITDFGGWRKYLRSLAAPAGG